MAKLTLKKVASNYASTNNINANSTAIENALENTLSRDGTAPNAMEAQLDMNSNRIINLGQPVEGSDAARKDYVDGLINPIITGGGITETVSYDYGTQAALASHSDTDLVIVTNYHSADEVVGSGNRFHFTGTTTAGKASDWPNADGYFYDALGQQYEVERKVLSSFGAVGDDLTDDTAAVTAWLACGQAIGSTLYATTGSYRTEPHDILLTNDLEIRCAKSAAFRYVTSSLSAEPLFDFDGDSLTYGVYWYGGEIDGRDGVFVSAGQSNTGLSLIRCRNNYIEGVLFRGEASRDAAVASTTGTDSGITTVACISTRVHGCHFVGWGDAGIYFSGDDSDTISTLGDGGYDSVTGCYFGECQQAVTTKRQANGLIFTANNCYRCYLGISLLETDSATLSPGRNVIVSNNFFNYIETRAVEIQRYYGARVVNNTVVDFGIDLTDDTTESGVPQAIRLRGALGCVVTGNHIGMDQWTAGGNAIGIQIDDVTISSTSYKAKYNTVADNVFVGIDIGVNESSDSEGPTYLRDNIFIDVTTELSLQNDESSFNRKRLLEGWTDFDIVDTGNAAGGAATTLHEYTTPTEVFSEPGDGYLIESGGGTSSNANAKTLYVQFDGTDILTHSLPTSQGSTYHITGHIIRVDSSRIKYSLSLTVSNSSGGGTTQTAVYGGDLNVTNFNSAKTIRIRGAASAEDDVVNRASFIKVFR